MLLPAYVQECGSCHVPYPPGLLPNESWQRLMANLPQHFGTDASLDAADAEGAERLAHRDTPAAASAPASRRRRTASPAPTGSCASTASARARLEARLDQERRQLRRLPRGAARATYDEDARAHPAMSRIGDQHDRTRPLVWDLPVRVFHWLLVASFAGAFLTADSSGCATCT